jgi:hypothetical protein
MKKHRNFIFTITAGHTGTTWLASLLGANLPNSAVYHELLGYDRFGVDTPDLSHMTVFNSRGNVDYVQAFWRQKADRILEQPLSWYGETSHLLAKCGLLENIELFSRHGNVHIICLERDLYSIVRSMHLRHDMSNKGDQWLWHLDPDYPRKLLSPSFFLPHGLDGVRLWYACEMLTRAAYYRQLLQGEKNVYLHRLKIEDMADAKSCHRFFESIGAPVPPEEFVYPNKSNASRADQLDDIAPISKLIATMAFDPEAIATQYIGRGYTLGVDLTK